MMGPISPSGKYKKWVYAVVALRRALLLSGSDADLLAFLALDDGAASTRMAPAEEAMLSAQGVRFRYVRAPLGMRGFHMGHFKLWAWQHTEYDRIQMLDADVLPLVDMDALFSVQPGAAFVGCPGKYSVLNAGWFLLRPSCAHFRGLTQLLFERGPRKGHAWDGETGWGVQMPPWRGGDGKTHKQGWDFFDSRGNQGHMYAYFRFVARDLTLIYEDEVVAYRGDAAAAVAVATNPRVRRAGAPRAAAPVGADGAARANAAVVYGAFPCPFPAMDEARLAYFHFTGNSKPWTLYDPSNARYAQWYAMLEGLGIDVRKQIIDAT
mmetsp:Transcript_27337/g.94490  ORF Transcript_27337/g.94490 Transcript_27337/m.94490 type:complete len:322 (+) Transcript_27337:1946-2911(+)